MSLPHFSIITICFNAGESLRRTIESVNGQTYPQIEHLIIDGGSSDGSVALIQGMARRNVRWISEPDGGIADAFNKGTALATGDYVCYLNAGDVFATADVLAGAAAEIVREPALTPTIYYGDFYSIHADALRPHQTSDRLEDFEWENPINHQSAFVPRQLAQRYPYDKRLSLGMDYDFWLRVRQQAQFKKLKFPIAVFAPDGRSGDPAWAIHRLLVRRVFWHVNRGSRLEGSDVICLLWRIFKVKLRFGVRGLLSKTLLQAIRRRRATKASAAFRAGEGQHGDSR